MRDVCRRIFAVFDCNIDDYSKELPSHLKSVHNPVPQAIYDRAVNLTEGEANWGVKQYILGSILSNKREALIRAIKDILYNDTDMLPTEVVGYPGFEKKAILDSDTFEESAVIASVLRYSALCDNKALASSVKEIPADYLDGFIIGEPIYFIDESEDQDDISPLKRTLRDPLFDRIFIPAASIKIPGMANPATASVYYIRPQNCKFRFRNMESFIISNIGSYVYSRARVLQIQNLTKNDAAVGSNAMLKFMKTYGSEASTVLGEILLYVFLEQVLGAPKIMSKIEISELNGSYISKSDGVHLLREEISGQPFHQLVFGASDITGNLNAAIDRAFGKIIQIENNYDDELKVIDNTRHQTIFDPEATRFMVDLMTPKRDGSYKPDMAFGAFLGYTIVLDTPETDGRKYGKAVEEQLKKDIFAAQLYLEKKIRESILKDTVFIYMFSPSMMRQKKKKA